MTKNRLNYLIILLLSIQISNAQSIIPASAKLEKVASGFKKLEGPAWKDGSGLFFSDINDNAIYLWSSSDNSVKTHIKPSGNSNGLAFDNNGHLIIAQMGTHQVTKQEFEGNNTILASIYNGKRLNSPNDIAIKSDGSIFFTDPDFFVSPGEKQLKFCGIYRISLSGTIQLLDCSLLLPNGICFSPDEKKLYVNDSEQRVIYVWDVINDSLIINKRFLYKIPVPGYADGMKTDRSGNLFCAGPTGIWIISSSGKYLDKITLPEGPSNCCWGDNDKNTLYITAEKSIYRISLTKPNDLEQTNVYSESFGLSQNYPNPFRIETKINYQISPSISYSEAFVKLIVFDTYGKNVATLVNDRQQAGEYQIKFPLEGASGFHAGIYYYTLLISNPCNKDVFTQTKKFIIMK